MSDPLVDALNEWSDDPLLMNDHLADFLRTRFVIVPVDTVRTGWSRLDDDGNVIIGNTISQHIDDGQIPVIVAPAP